MLRKEDFKFKASPAYRTGPYLEKQTEASGTVWPNMCVSRSKRVMIHIGMYLYSGIKEKRGRSVIAVREPFPQRQNPVWGPSGQAHKSKNRQRSGYQKRCCGPRRLPIAKVLESGRGNDGTAEAAILD